MKGKDDLKNALCELEKIVEDLGKKDVDVEEGLTKFKEGVELIQFCRSQLKKSENEFKKLKSELDNDAEATNIRSEKSSEDLPF